MSEIEVEGLTTKGTRILFGEVAELKQQIVETATIFTMNRRYRQMYIPILQFESLYKDKVGEDKEAQMYSFSDRGGRELCLAPEYTAVVQQLAKTYFKMQKDVKLFYIAECFRGEKPQSGRYRQFTQFGCEVINPTQDYSNELIRLAERICTSSALIRGRTPDEIDEHFWCDISAKRGLDYYTEGKGFEMGWSLLGAQQQICGGGAYEGGIGFAIGIDRLMLL